MATLPSNQSSKYSNINTYLKYINVYHLPRQIFLLDLYIAPVYCFRIPNSCFVISCDTFLFPNEHQEWTQTRLLVLGKCPLPYLNRLLFLLWTMQSYCAMWIQSIQSLSELPVQTMAWVAPMSSLLAGDHFTVTFCMPCIAQLVAEGLCLAFLAAVDSLPPKPFREMSPPPIQTFFKKGCHSVMLSLTLISSVGTRLL